MPTPHSGYVTLNVEHFWGNYCPMEWFTILLSSFIAAITPVGFIVDTVVANTLRAQVAGVEELAVRVDNTPSYQPIQGKVDRIRIASRGLEPIENLRIDSFELETDPLDFDLNRIQQPGGIKKLRESLRKPFQGAFRMVIKETDLNQALESPNIKVQIQKLLDQVLPPQAPRFEIVKLRLNFLQENRLGLEVELKQEAEEGQESNQLDITAEVSFQVEGGRSIKLIDLSATLNERKLSQRFLGLLTEGINQQLDLAIFENQGFIARILKLNLNEDTLDIVAFFRLNPASAEEP
ncbi:DUF2993 domain-containing protein [Crocosphaera sp. UHCC 0190]|uniref:LmeA family phospholipid-binding protein n=1 Tax=Crocosphaera sp. UHCC 0190 TaxID=3110246 RepID=UPI002B1EB0B2|nr:DUF2993 domain-containing protein [Crocosphaera sp. UHCC 0190]MEA5510281.1 DUF2993 domain-containing protein [Crocosphaera sp. UHCC 0190]